MQCLIGDDRDGDNNCNVYLVPAINQTEESISVILIEIYAKCGLPVGFKMPWYLSVCNRLPELLGDCA